MKPETTDDITKLIAKRRGREKEVETQREGASGESVGETVLSGQTSRSARMNLGIISLHIGPISAALNHRKTATEHTVSPPLPQ
ncbi:hypothetical protein ILYODFUR_018181 [Ilyodon furcidens]|uniref:Uncharacterized protein n=1 Tax=Ilyodon furcidens TaxID=33524 RepID=A0ABV0SY28_9TELE